MEQIPAGVSDCGTLITNDQRGFARPADGACDIGAVEVVNYAPMADTYTTSEEIALSISASGLLTNDVDGDWDALTSAPPWIPAPRTAA
jgi:hypothetical protein